MSETLERLSMAQAPLSVLLIAFNAGDGLEAVIGAWDKYLAGLARSYEILVVNDGSSDDTRAARRPPCQRKLARATSAP